MTPRSFVKASHPGTALEGSEQHANGIGSICTAASARLAAQEQQGEQQNALFLNLLGEHDVGGLRLPIGGDATVRALLIVQVINVQRAPLPTQRVALFVSILYTLQHMCFLQTRCQISWMLCINACQLEP